MSTVMRKCCVISLIIMMFFLGYHINDIVIKINNNDNKLEKTISQINHYNDIPYYEMVDSIAILSLKYRNLAIYEFDYYIENYNKPDYTKYPNYYLTSSNDTIIFNKENFYYFVGMYYVATNILESRNNIINGLLVNGQMLKHVEKE